MFDQDLNDLNDLDDIYYEDMTDLPLAGHLDWDHSSADAKATEHMAQMCLFEDY